MKTLYLLRHAKSSWSFDELSDSERPLNDRGRDDAPRMGQALARRDITLDRLVSSPAVRALTTATLVARELSFATTDIAVEPGIYQADVPTLLALVRAQPDAAASVLLTGHNPGLTDLTNALLPTPFSTELPTAALVCLRFSISRWAEVAPGAAELYFYDYPRGLS